MKTYQLTQHFTLNEFTRSATANAHGTKQNTLYQFHEEFACLFHAEYAEFAEKNIPIILRILREKNGEKKR